MNIWDILTSQESNKKIFKGSVILQIFQTWQSKKLYFLKFKDAIATILEH
jgi:hypothetical protein